MSLLKILNIKYNVNSFDKEINVSHELKDQSILNVKAPSGGGKTTLLKILGRLIQAKSGEVEYNGKNWDEFDLKEWRQIVHFVPQKPAIYDGSVIDNIKIPFSLKINKNKKFDIKEVKKLLKKLDLTDDFLLRDAKQLSYGESTRIGFIRALITKPSVILLDEPESGLHKNAKIAFYNTLINWLDEKNRGIILVSHNIDYNFLPNIETIELF